ncbi:acyltransferase [Limimaricola litoreus]|uniref:Acyltransferase n=1 Tax=Limimaricola litoreus TaxID=2955316 RepID=A0A9X2FS91_9RHOB|nr:acyltransferase [Limimaricola litoreus]MCP1169285.1 acyltransferase [Limimaricola litoreus]
MGEISYKVQDEVAGRRSSTMQKYQDMVIGSRSLWALIRYELIMLFVCPIPGALGLFLRGKLYPLILGECGRGVVFGRNITLRHPHKIRLGDRVIIDDNVLMDAKGKTNTGISIAQDCFIGRNSILSCKDGNIELGERANVGFNAEIFSCSRVRIGADVLISAYCYVVGGGNYDLAQREKRINRSLREDRARGIELADDVWIGTHSVLMDGVTIGTGTAVAAGSVVTAPMPEGVIVAGTPARVLRERPAKSPSAGETITREVANESVQAKAAPPEGAEQLAE